MKLVAPSKSHIQQMMNWFVDEQSLNVWAGPNFRYPFDIDTFTEDLRLTELASYSLLDESQTLLGFGQYYSRLDRCHLGRLVVSPHHRKIGIGQLLMEKLCAQGTQALKVNSTSLFVLDYNKSAIRAYLRFGFRFQKYPEELSIENCLYMVK